MSIKKESLMSTTAYRDLPGCSVDELLTMQERDRLHRRAGQQESGPLWFSRPWGHLVVDRLEASVSLVMRQSRSQWKPLADKDVSVLVSLVCAFLAWGFVIGVVVAPVRWTGGVVFIGCVVTGVVWRLVERWVEAGRGSVERVDLVPDGHLMRLLAGRHGPAEQQVALQFLACEATDPRVLDCLEGLQLVRGVTSCRLRARRLGEADVSAAASLLVQSLVTAAHREVIDERVCELGRVLSVREEQRAVVRRDAGQEDAARLGVRLDDAMRPLLTIVPNCGAAES